MNNQINHDPAASMEQREARKPNLDQYDSVRQHLQQRLNREVAQLEARIDALRHGRAPHKAIIIATYERMIARKLGFMNNWNLCESPRSSHH
jgi:hypothetical protein